MIQPRYLAALAFGAFLWGSLFLSFIWIIDPYGISPVQVSLNHINQFKHKRINIDRVIKPYEVWKYQPRTVFLGTSRIQQSIDPAVLDGTEYALAYNASIPANMVSENAAYIDQYFELNKHLKYVFVELFLYNFVFPEPAPAPTTMMSMIRDIYPLNFSDTALFDSYYTIRLNMSGHPPTDVISPRGHRLNPPDRGGAAEPDRNIAWVMRLHRQIPKMELQPAAFHALERIQASCEKHGAKLFLIMTPNFPYDDYRLLSLGYWDLLEDWYRKLARYPNVLSFTQYNDVVAEPPSDHMTYWYDILHFSERTATLALKAFLGKSDPEIPGNMMVPVNSENVERVLKERRKGLEKWIARNLEFTTAFDEAKFATGNDPSQRQGK